MKMLTSHEGLDCECWWWRTPGKSRSLLIQTRNFSLELLTQHVAIIWMIIDNCWVHFLTISFNLKNKLCQHMNAQCKPLFMKRDLQYRYEYSSPIGNTAQPHQVICISPFKIPAQFSRVLCTKTSSHFKDSHAIWGGCQLFFQWHATLIQSFVW